MLYYKKHTIIYRIACHRVKEYLQNIEQPYHHMALLIGADHVLMLITRIYYVNIVL